MKALKIIQKRVPEVSTKVVADHAFYCGVMQIVTKLEVPKYGRCLQAEECSY